MEVFLIFLQWLWDIVGRPGRGERMQEERDGLPRFRYEDYILLWDIVGLGITRVAESTKILVAYFGLCSAYEDFSGWPFGLCSS